MSRRAAATTNWYMLPAVLLLLQQQQSPAITALMNSSRSGSRNSLARRRPANHCCPLVLCCLFIANLICFYWPRSMSDDDWVSAPDAASQRSATNVWPLELAETMSYCGAICQGDLARLGSIGLVGSDTASDNRCIDIGIDVAVVGTRGEHVSSVSCYAMTTRYR